MVPVVAVGHYSLVNKALFREILFTKREHYSPVKRVWEDRPYLWGQYSFQRKQYNYSS